MLTLTQEWNGYDRILIIDEENNASVQLTIYKDEKMTAFLHSLYVPKNKRRKGHGTLLLKKALFISKNQKKKAELHVVRDNTRAITLYKRLGFKEDKAHSTAYVLKMVME